MIEQNRRGCTRVPLTCRRKVHAVWHVVYLFHWESRYRCRDRRHTWKCALAQGSHAKSCKRGFLASVDIPRKENEDDDGWAIGKDQRTFFTEFFMKESPRKMRRRLVTRHAMPKTSSITDATQVRLTIVYFSRSREDNLQVQFIRW